MSCNATKTIKLPVRLVRYFGDRRSILLSVDKIQEVDAYM